MNTLKMYINNNRQRLCTCMYNLQAKECFTSEQKNLTRVADKTNLVAFAFPLVSFLRKSYYVWVNPFACLFYTGTLFTPGDCHFFLLYILFSDYSLITVRVWKNWVIEKQLTSPLAKKLISAGHQVAFFIFDDAWFRMFLPGLGE